MAAAEITRVSLPHTEDGYNLTDSAGFTALVAGAGNGVQFDWVADSIVLLKNPTGGAAVYTLKVVTPTSYSSYSATITNPTISVGAAKTFILRLDELFKNAGGKTVIECDVAGEALVLAP